MTWWEQLNDVINFGGPNAVWLVFLVLAPAGLLVVAIFAWINSLFFKKSASRD
jgi:hypothetical protein